MIFTRHVLHQLQGREVKERRSSEHAVRKLEAAHVQHAQVQQLKADAPSETLGGRQTVPPQRETLVSEHIGTIHLR